jgi:predicted metal-binding membrane protein
MSINPDEAAPLARQRHLLLALLLALAAAAWALLLWQSEGGEDGMAMASPTMGMA